MGQTRLEGIIGTVIGPNIVTITEVWQSGLGVPVECGGSALGKMRNSDHS